MGPVEQGPVVVHRHVRSWRAVGPGEEVIAQDRVLEGSGPGIGLDDVGHHEIDSGVIGELEGPIEDRWIVPLQAEHEGPHDVDSGVVHSLHSFSEQTCVVRPFIQAVDGGLTHRLDSQEKIAAAALVGKSKELRFLG